MSRVLLMVAFVGALVLWQVQHRAVIEEGAAAAGAETAGRAP